MNENKATEINEDNCILDGQDLTVIKMILNKFAEKKQKNGTPVQKIIDIYFEKINKLNDLAKKETGHGRNR